MKKFLISLLTVLCIGFTASAQDGFGIVGGVTTSCAKLQDFNFDSITQYHLGFAFKTPNLFGFAAQPELCYNVKGSRSEVYDLKMGYAEFGLQLQWGPDLVLFRPYVFAEPYLGYAVNNWRIENGAGSSTPEKQANVWTNLKRTEVGLGIGGGVELFGALQLSAKHFQNFGEIYTADYHYDGSNFGGWVFTLGIFF